MLAPLLTATTVLSCKIGSADVEQANMRAIWQALVPHDVHRTSCKSS
jgi:hypothetical protein